MKNYFRLFAIIGSLLLMACSEKENIKPVDGTRRQNARSGLTSNVDQSVCPASITLVGQKIKTNFGQNNSFAVAISQNGMITESASSTAGASGNWISKNKYQSKELSLLVTDNSTGQTCECKYDNNGMMCRLLFYKPLFLILRLRII